MKTSGRNTDTKLSVLTSEDNKAVSQNTLAK
jgi:hypothetical protein